MRAAPAIDAERLLGRIAALGAVGALPGGGVRRLALSAEDKAGRDLLCAWMRDLGLPVLVDGIGNIFGVRAGRHAGPPLLLGSHIDTVSTGGLYDGALGVLAGLEVVAALNDAGAVTDRPLAVAAFTNEEGARFAPDMMGSLVFAGGLALAEALATADADGRTVGDCLDAIGYRGDADPFPDGVHAYLELHIEQGPVLESEGAEIGVVEGVQGISWTEIALSGAAAHAGTTPMSARRDAGYAAAAIAAGARRLAAANAGLRATVGAMTLFPNLVNVVAEGARLTVDLRHPDEAGLVAAETGLDRLVAEVAAAEGVGAESRRLARFAPVRFDPGLVAAVEEAALRRGFGVRRLQSGAGHDAQMLARICPAAMIFVPSAGGVSHNVREFTAAEDVVRGAEVLLGLVSRIAGGFEETDGA